MKEKKDLAKTAGWYLVGIMAVVLFTVCVIWLQEFIKYNPLIY